jgi:protein-disulfide isomerase
MRILLFLLPSVMLFGQAAHKAGGANLKDTNFKEAGSPSAPITLELYTDYQCPSCRNFYMEVLPPLISQYVATGKVRLIHRDFPLPQHQYTRVATKYANAAGEIGRYDVVAGQIFKTQPEWEQNGNIDGEVAKVLPPAEMQKVRELVKSDTHLDDTVNSDLAMGARDGLNQTPTLVIVHNGKRQKIDGVVPFNILKSYIDQLLAKG